MLLASALLVGGLVHGDATVPHRISVRMLLKALSYDHNLVSRSGDGIRIGALLQTSSADSDADARAFVAELREVLDSPAMKSFLASSGKGLGIDVSELPAASSDDARTAMGSSRVNLVYLSRGWTATEVKGLINIAERRKILVVASTREQVEAGAALAVLPVDGRPRFVVNVASSLKQGAHFDSGMLGLSELVR